MWGDLLTQDGRRLTSAHPMLKRDDDSHDRTSLLDAKISGVSEVQELAPKLSTTQKGGGVELPIEVD